MADKRINRALLLGTFLIFFVPIVGAWLMNVFIPDWRPFGTTNFGTLVQPVRSLDAKRLRTADGQPVDPGLLSGQWTVVHLPGAECGQPCVDTLARSRQVQLALGDDMNRVRLLLILPEASTPPATGLPEGVTTVVAGTDWLETFDGETLDVARSVCAPPPAGFFLDRITIRWRGVILAAEGFLCPDGGDPDPAPGSSIAATSSRSP